jgi:hypothetical protein
LTLGRTSGVSTRSWTAAHRSMLRDLAIGKW